MIEGMEILKKVELIKVFYVRGWWVVPLIITCLLLFLGILIVCLWIKGNDYDITDVGKIGSGVSLAVLICGILISVSLGIFSVQNKREVPSGKYIYEVTFSSENAFTEAYREYDFLGENSTYEDVYSTIYVIRDKGVDFDYILSK